MTPDDMEGRLEAFIRWLDPDNREPFSGSSLQIVADLRALLLDYQERGREIEKLRGAISWLDQPFIDEKTSKRELLARIGFAIADRDRAALNQKGKSHD